MDAAVGTPASVLDDPEWLLDAGEDELMAAVGEEHAEMDGGFRSRRARHIAPIVIAPTTKLLVTRLSWAFGSRYMFVMSCSPYGTRVRTQSCMYLRIGRLEVY